KKILIIQGHPDASVRHFGHALAESYEKGAVAAGHTVRRLEVARLQFPLVHSQTEWKECVLSPDMRDAQDAVRWADHIAIFFPLWLGTMPALLKGFLEQVLRPGFALVYEGYRFPQKGLTGKSGRIVVTMGMPAFWYRWFFRAHGVRGLERSILGFCGVEPVRETFIGLVETKKNSVRMRWLDKLETLGREAV
ncbi:MAG TPA: NAD(P)H-dependent oxidoreductase, partial [Candidatus Didemnitutus sp.]|nr:NAD(P)H-dependent oxidoreductase [Candidatus Didemnitutus sp.]